MPTPPLPPTIEFDNPRGHWYQRFPLKKVILVLLALTWFMVGQSDLVDVPYLVRQATHSSQKSNDASKTAATHKPKKSKYPKALYDEAAVKAQSYMDSMHLSEEALRDQLTTKRDKYPPEVAQYAIEHVHADYPANALLAAKDMESRGINRAEDIMAKLTGADYKYTPSDAEYALKQLFPPDIVNWVLSRDK
ncbi:hypothetical protein KIM372_07370 [Bombiscardovia nodaiensis]|uniref:Putative host cell surface-exposed lipoprotein Ltp-like HTH region domain-containing protein n=1 Tax=Bombiscardovia nodaiensis TaxID=2932181 RepID=A0ABM8B829_9BIFI|nr:hypothetical protein KIM372_07370 [Bombiscardovia nodaiensis]